MTMEIAILIARISLLVWDVFALAAGDNGRSGSSNNNNNNNNNDNNNNHNHNQNHNHYQNQNHNHNNIVINNPYGISVGTEDVGDSDNVAEMNGMNWKCPSECVCLSHTQALCNNGDLNSVIYRLPWSVEHLSLTKSHIPYIKSQSFAELKRLSKLSLDGNNITRIQQFAFKGLRKLQELSIQHTSLSRLEKFVFSGLQNVTAILLSHNKINSIEEYAFAGTSHVRLVLLAHNPLHVIRSNAFSGLRNVEHLILPSGIRSIEPEAFRGLDSVGLVKLAFMDLAELRELTFGGLNHVHVLAVQQSDLGTVRARAFDGLTNVGTLNLINNKIDYLEELKIRRESRVKIVRLVGNHVLKLPSTASAIRVYALDNFTVVGNHFPCDCASRFLLGNALANGTSYNFSLKNFCISPLNLNGKSIYEMRRTRLLASCAGPADYYDSNANADSDTDADSDSASNSDSWNLAASSPIRHHFATFTRFFYYACFFSFHRTWTSNALRF